MKLKILDDFRKDEQGGILAFYIIMFMVMMIGGGMSIDFIRHETRRAALQDALDRGVLAAAGNAQTSNPQTPAEIAAAEETAIQTVRSYIQVAGFDPDAAGVVITPNFSRTEKRVDVASNFAVDTYFLRLTGIDILNGTAASAAKLGANQIEISLVVDISGSMAGTKMNNLRSAALDFTTLMLGGDRSQYTTISLVPFSAQVAVPDSVISSYNYDRRHSLSSCVNFKASDYDSLSISSTTQLEQTKHFTAWWIANDSYYCPKDRLSIVPLSNSIADLQLAINGTVTDPNTGAVTTVSDGLVATGDTASHVGMKWGLNLLDHGSSFVVDNLIASGDVDPAFTGRPAPYSDGTTLKFVILMTDGDNTSEYDVRYPYYYYQGYDWIVDPSKDPGEAPNYLAPTDVYNQNIADGKHGYLNYQRASDERTALMWDAAAPLSSNYRPDYLMPWDNAHVGEVVGPTEANFRLQKLCTQAKNQGIIIFTIAYDVSIGSSAYNQMNACASTGNFYNVGTSELAAAYASIYQTIQKLKLTF